MEPAAPVSQGLCKKCDCHLPPSEIPPETPYPYPPFEPISIEMLQRKTERKNFDEEEPGKSEPEESEESEESEETISLYEYNKREEDKKLNEDYRKLMRKKWEVREEKELMRLKEEEVNIDENELDVRAQKALYKDLVHKRESLEKKLKDLYVKQLNDLVEDSEEDDEKIAERYELDKEIRSIESDIEMSKASEKELKNEITEAQAKILSGRAKIARERKEIEEVKEVREREMKEDEEGKWPGEPRWYI